MSYFKITLSIASIAILLTCFSAGNAFGKIADRHSAAKMIPAGNYLCQMGSYKYRPCTVEAKGDAVVLVIPAGKGHYISMRAEILASDADRKLTVVGKFISPRPQCPTCADGNPKGKCPATVQQKTACETQSLVARMTKKGTKFTGKLMYFILRYSYDRTKKPATALPLFKLGNAMTFNIKPAK